MPLPVGARLGPYEVLAPLGAGGMGEVYRAKDPRLGRPSQVKEEPITWDGPCTPWGLRARRGRIGASSSKR